MEAVALYIGYIVIALIILVVIGFLLLVLWGVGLALYRIAKYKQTLRFIARHETKDMYKACDVAVKFLISKVSSPDITLREVQDLIGDYGKRYKIKED